MFLRYVAKRFASSQCAMKSNYNKINFPNRVENTVEILNGHRQSQVSDYFECMRCKNRFKIYSVPKYIKYFPSHITHKK